MTDLRQKMVRESATAVLGLATKLVGIALDDVVVLVADEHDPAARMVLDPLGRVAPSAPASAPAPGEMRVLVEVFPRERLASIVEPFDADMAGRLRVVRSGTIMVLAVGDGGAHTAHLTIPAQGTA